MKDWDDYRFFLAVAETGSVSAAARVIGASQPTVSRRIAELEKRTNVRLFHHTPSGYILTELGEEILERVQSIARETQWIERKVHHADSAPGGRVVLTTTEDIGCICLAPLLRGLHDQHPEINLDLMITYQAADLISGEADIALRVGQQRSSQLIGRRIATVSFNLYASGDYLERHGTPKAVEDLADHQIIDSVRQLNGFPQVDWLRRHAPGARAAFICDNIMMQLSALRAGLGIIALPGFMADNEPNVYRVLDGAFDLSSDVWLLAPRELTRTQRVRAVIDYIAAHAPRLINAIADEQAIAARPNTHTTPRHAPAYGARSRP